ncbi:MAG: hypothetical protein U1E53_15965 [Dongiaceae bacterium]
MKSPPAKIDACRAGGPPAPAAALSFAPADIDSRSIRMEAGGRTVRVQFRCKADRPCVERGGEAALQEAWMTCPGLTACNNLALDLATLLDALAAGAP